MKTRQAKKEDLNELKEIWKLCFGDDDRYIDFYFQSRDWVKETAVLVQDGRIASMLAMIPVDLVDEDGKMRRASMLFAIATHPDFQKQGCAGQLIEYSNESLLSRQVSVTLLVPAGEDLFRYYEKLGYRNGFFVREAVLSRKEIEAMAAARAPGTSTALKAIEPAEYNRIRKNQLTGRPRLDYRDEELTFEKGIAVMYGTDLFSIETDGVKGCAYAERLSEEEVIVKELLIPDQYAAAALKQLTERLPAEKYIVRTPSYYGRILGGSVRPFGMLRFNGSHGRSVAKASNLIDTDSYLGIAYD